MTLITPLGFAGCSESSNPTYCEITFKNYDSSILFYTSIKYGEDAVYQGETPIRPSSNEFTYVFSGWDKPLKSIKTDTTFIAQYEQFDRLYNITWSVNGEDTVEQYKYNEMPTFKGDTSKSSDAQYTYTFSGWSSEVVSVTGDATYVAQYSTTVNHYTVTWNVDGNITTEEYAYGETPTFKGSTAKSADAQYTYTFTGWSPNVTSVSGDVTYTAIYSSATNKYLIRWLDWNGDLLDSQNIEYGESPEYHGTTLTRDSDDDYDYEFDCWSPEISDVTCAVDYIATYSSSRNHFNVLWTDWDGTELEKDEHIAKGEIPSFDGDEPFRETDGENVYSFIGWSPTIRPLDCDVAYIAQYSSKKHNFRVESIIMSGATTSVTKNSIYEYTGSDEIVETITSINGYTISGISLSGSHRGTFENNTTVKKVIINQKNTEKIGYQIGVNAFRNCTSIEEVVFPETLSLINGGAFEGCISLKSINLPSSLKGIGGSFKNCTSLGNIIFSEGLLSILPNSFQNCTSLENLLFPESLTFIGSEAFRGCSSLKTVTISKNISTIQSWAFKDCDSLETFRFLGDVDDFNITNLSAIFDNTKVEYIQCNDGVIPLS